MSEQVKRRVRRSSEQWQEVIHSQQQSGLSARAFCEQQQDIGYASFCNWRKRLSAVENQQGACRSASDADFIDLSALPASQPSGWQIVLKLGDGMELSLSRG